jgi:hypothetical protein
VPNSTKRHSSEHPVIAALDAAKDDLDSALAERIRVARAARAQKIPYAIIGYRLGMSGPAVRMMLERAGDK